MRRVYIIVGFSTVYQDCVDTYYAVCHSMKRAEELCLKAEAEDDTGRIYTWYEVIEEDDENG